MVIWGNVGWWRLSIKSFFSHKKLVSGCNKTHYAAPSGIERAQNTKTHGTSHSSAQISSRLTNFQSFLTKLLYLGKTCNLQRVLSWRNSLPNLGILGICWKAYFWSSKTFYFWSSQFLKCPQPQSFPVKNDPVFPDPKFSFSWVFPCKGSLMSFGFCDRKIVSNF